MWQTLVGAWLIGPRTAGRVPAQGDARGQDADLLDRARPGVRVGGARPSPSAVLDDAGADRGDRRLRGRDRAGRPGELARRRSWCSSPCPAWPTSTRAASWPACPWSTRTTAGRSTSPRRQRLLAALDAAGTSGHRRRPGRGEAAGHLARAAAAPRPPGLVRRASYTPLAAEGPAAGHAFAFLRGGRRGHRRHPAARRAAAARRLGRHRAAAARTALARRAHRRHGTPACGRPWPS